jgi:hypothetical protein
LLLLRAFLTHLRLSSQTLLTHLLHVLLELGLLVGRQDAEDLIVELAGGLGVARTPYRMRLNVLIEHALNSLVLIACEIDSGKHPRPAAIDPRGLLLGAGLLLGNGRLLAGLLS